MSAMINVNLTLPFPPSGNHMYKHTRQGHHYLTPIAREYYKSVALIVHRHCGSLELATPLEVTCTLFPPDKRRRDLDNAWKVVGDALTKCGFWMDDKWIRKLTLQWSEVQTPAVASLFIGNYVEKETTL
ncbi:RusA family crossover junction endodeoxyribonuclease [Polynucleobacter sp. UB-Piko-W3]|uniref:RusA family crossover junction endodeoxyribonuclease n=1 Tax=Polynucleobacter sp. UB-Piko-W3 TaxID=1819735 RepID=UPI001C0D67E8|nr:RusA family crossover junction endodeoxyribonuclease [Polynucleobacter sp. UB-Piko-W3]MBU3554842.1 RusA family crossover junction endodeoxyribonuclease [Polynucleobacter sp. UB-Piko-W3]